MTLAAILLFGISCTASAPPWIAVAAAHQSAVQSAEQSAPQPAPGNPANASESQDQGGAAAKSPPPSSPTPSAGSAASGGSAAPQSSSVQTQPSAPKHRRHKKKQVASNCDPPPAAAAGSAAPGSDPSSTAPATTATGESTATPAPPSTPTNCPPSKIVVRHGGTSESSVQLAGGTAGDQAHERASANQLLASTEKNLNKIQGRQLSPNQQDMVNQIHQFMEQSKSAVTAGDLERARTLAWKAQLLSEELVKPQK